MFVPFVKPVEAENRVDACVVRRRSGGQRAGTWARIGREVRERVLSRLRSMGIACVDAAPGKVSAQLVNRYLDIKRRELIA